MSSHTAASNYCSALLLMQAAAALHTTTPALNRFLRPHGLTGSLRRVLTRPAPLTHPACVHAHPSTSQEGCSASRMAGTGQPAAQPCEADHAEAQARANIEDESAGRSGGQVSTSSSTAEATQPAAAAVAIIPSRSPRGMRRKRRHGGHGSGSGNGGSRPRSPSQASHSSAHSWEEAGRMGMLRCMYRRMLGKGGRSSRAIAVLNRTLVLSEGAEVASFR